MKKETRALLGIGSDDGVKLSVNGKLAHENWTSRGAQADDDIVPVSKPAKLPRQQGRLVRTPGSESSVGRSAPE